MLLKKLFSVIHFTLMGLPTASSLLQSWNPVTVSTTVLYDPTLQNTTYSAESDMVCSILASRYSWASLFCYSGGSCFISSLKTVQRYPPYNVTSPMDCMTTLDYGCLQANGTLMPNNAVYAPNSCSKFLCNNGVIEQIEPSTCPFTLVKGYGCYKYVSVNRNYSAARADCPTLNICSQMAEFEGVVDPSFIPYVASALNITQGFWIGSAGIGPPPNRIWTWMTSKLSVTLNPAMWAAGYPSDAFPNGGYIDSSFKYSQKLSLDPYPYLCEVKGNF